MPPVHPPEVANAADAGLPPVPLAGEAARVVTISETMRSPLLHLRSRLAAAALEQG